MASDPEARMSKSLNDAESNRNLETVSTDAAGSDMVAWSPLATWRLHGLYAPIAEAVHAVVSRDSDGSSPARVLEVGGTPGILQALLASGTESVGCEIVSVRDVERDLAGFADGEFACVVAVDWLPAVAPSQREHLVRELGRAARRGVVLANPFHAPEIVAAERRLNVAYRAMTGVDHPTLGRHLEYGLPDSEVVRGWLGDRFSYSAERPLEDLSAWRASETLAMVTGEPGTASQGLRAPIAPLGPVSTTEGATPYRSLLVAALHPIGFEVKTGGEMAAHPALAALVMYHTVEAAAQRRSLDSLVEAVTSDRERERAEFRDAVASLAAELRERETQAEFLAREVRKRDERIANQTATIHGLQRQVEETAVHVRNLEAQLAMLQAESSDVESEDERLDRAYLEARLAQAEERAEAAEQAFEHIKEVHERFLKSRGGRALTRYVNLKRSILGRKEP